MTNDDKYFVLSQESPSQTQSIADSLAIKDQNVFFVCRPDGTVPFVDDSRTNHGYGLFHRDCRYLCGYEFLLGDVPLDILVSNAQAGYQSVVELSNPEVELNGRTVPKEHIAIRWDHTIDGANTSLEDTITFENFDQETIEFSCSFRFQTLFDDIFIVRGRSPGRSQTTIRPKWRQDALVWRYSGKDGIDRSLVVRIRPEPTKTKTDQVFFLMKIPARGRKQLRISFHIAERKHHEKAAVPKRSPWNMERKHKDLQTSMRRWLRKGMQIKCDSLLLGRALERSMIDLGVLRSKLDQKEFFAAGIPWFATLFGRDTIFACIQTLAFRSAISRQTLELLAKTQGSKIDDWRDEEPGKILHELRAGELANTRKIPHTPYYGTVDATPLFLILLGLYCYWTGDLSLFHKLRSNVRAALKWIDCYSDLTGTGFVQYDSPADSRHLANQGWKDSGNAIVNNDGTIATPPIALVEVQAYVFQAKQLMAELCDKAGERDLCRTLRQQAKTLQQHFNRKFWSNKLSTYCLALQNGGQPVQVISSNAGHALWCGIAPKVKARKVAKRLMSEEMFSGWGVRTLAETENAYNPIGYHLGSVWPHDNSILFAGLRRYGFDAEAMAILHGILDAAMHFRHYQLPELFAAFSKNEFPAPVRYPVACHPQAWAAGAIPFMISEMLGFHPNAFEKQLRIVRPLLPNFLNRLDVLGVKCGDGAADLHFERTSTSKVNVRVLKTSGDLDIVIQA